jgi:hypothetical protein
LKRITRLLTVAATVVTGTLVYPGTASAHHVVCSYTPNVPYQNWRGGPVYASARIQCNFAPDVSSTTVRIWRYDTNRKKYYIAAETTSNRTGTDWTLTTSGPCTATIAYPMHTQVINDAFHHNWGHSDKNSITVGPLYC